MRYLLILIIVLNQCVVIAAQGHTTTSKATVALLNEFRSIYIETFVTGKSEKLALFLDEEIRMMPPFQETIFGQANAVLYHNAFFERFKVASYERKEVEIIDLGSQVIEVGVFSMQLSLISSSEIFDIAGKYLNIWKKASDGKLFLITDAWNFDQYYEKLHSHLKFKDIPSVTTAFQPNVLINSNLKFELAALNKLLHYAVSAHDAAVWSQFYTDDSMLLANYVPLLKGKKAVDEYIKAHTAALPIFENLDIRNDRVDDLGNYIIEYASHIASCKNGDWSGVSTGKNIRIWRREPDHSLKLFRSITMYD